MFSDLFLHLDNVANNPPSHTRRRGARHSAISNRTSGHDAGLHWDQYFPNERNIMDSPSYEDNVKEDLFEALLPKTFEERMDFFIDQEAILKDKKSDLRRKQHSYRLEMKPVILEM
jgi:hypothetical protein